MNIHFSDNLKRLRKQHEMTQEDLAGFLGVSFQAVSKWERGEGYPDITILPSIAHFFHVTLDELMGMDQMKHSQQRDDIIKKSGQLASLGNIAETVTVLREGVRIFPNDYKIMAHLACYLDGLGSTCKEVTKNRDEAIQLSERILRFCTDPSIRNNVQANLCFLLWRVGRTEEAVERAKKLPGIYKTYEVILPEFLAGEEKIELEQTTIQKLTWAFWSAVNDMNRENHYSDEQKIELLKKSIAVYQIVYEKGDYGFAHLRLANAHENIAVLLFQNNRADEAFEYLAACADHCIAYDALAESTKHSSLLVNTLTFDKKSTSKSSEATASGDLLRRITSDTLKIYAPFKEDDRMKCVVAKLRQDKLKG